MHAILNAFKNTSLLFWLLPWERHYLSKLSTNFFGPLRKWLKGSLVLARLWSIVLLKFKDCDWVESLFFNGLSYSGGWCPKGVILSCVGGA